MRFKNLETGQIYEVTLVEDQVDSVPANYLSPHFTVAEMACNHCGKYGELASPELMEVLEDVRGHFGGVPVAINSGVRCAEHNKAVGGASNSRHLDKYAQAADIVVTDVAPSVVHKYLIDKYPGKYGIGRYSSFTHIDVRAEGPARW